MMRRFFSMSEGATNTSWAIPSDGHVRTGLEDNVRLDRDRLASSNASLVTRAVEIYVKYVRPVPTWRQTRSILGLRTVAL